MKSVNRKLLILCPYPKGTAPSQRFRFEQYLTHIEQAGWEVRQEPFWDEKSWQILYQKGHVSQKLMAIVRGYLRRYALLIQGLDVDVVFVHREISPMGFPWVAWWLSRILKKPIIYDFDDAIWIPNTSHSNRWSLGFKSYGNTAKLIRMSTQVFAGNAFLARFAQSCGGKAHIQIVPTTIDTEHHHNKVASAPEHPFVIGWTGSHSTMTYLDDLRPVIETLAKEIRLKWVVVSDVAPEFDMDVLEFRPWTKETEVDSMLDFHVGVMPLRPDAWAEGKCGFKALQYLALGIPALVSPVGVNSEIVHNGKNGYLCSDASEWLHCLRLLAGDKLLLQALSGQTRTGIIENYSVLAHRGTYIETLNWLAKM